MRIRLRFICIECENEPGHFLHGGECDGCAAPEAHHRFKLGMIALTIQVRYWREGAHVDYDLNPLRWEDR